MSDSVCTCKYRRRPVEASGAENMPHPQFTQCSHLFPQWSVLSVLVDACNYHCARVEVLEGLSSLLLWSRLEVWDFPVRLLLLLLLLLFLLLLLLCSSLLLLLLLLLFLLLRLLLPPPSPPPSSPSRSFSSSSSPSFHSFSSASSAFSASLLLLLLLLFFFFSSSFFPFYSSSPCVFPSSSYPSSSWNFSFSCSSSFFFVFFLSINRQIVFVRKLLSPAGLQPLHTVCPSVECPYTATTSLSWRQAFARIQSSTLAAG